MELSKRKSGFDESNGKFLEEGEIFKETGVNVLCDDQRSM